MTWQSLKDQWRPGPLPEGYTMQDNILQAAHGTRFENLYALLASMETGIEASQDRAAGHRYNITKKGKDACGFYVVPWTDRHKILQYAL